MPSAGYSGTPLVKKLGLTPALKVLLLHPPDNYFQLLEADLSAQLCRPRERETPDWVHLFAASRKIFEKGMTTLKPLWAKNTSIVIWVSWYKKTAKIQTDVTEDVIRNFALKNGLVDVKVCAVSEIWSGLKLVVPVKLR